MTVGGVDLSRYLLPFGFVVLVVAVVVVWASKQFFGEYFKKSGAKAFDRSTALLSRKTKLRKRLIRRYAEVVSRDYSRHALGFVTDRVIDIDSVYVPLQYEREGGREDLYEKIREQPQSVVIGPAGAGKSLLLKNSMLMWVRRVRAGATERMPVLIELHRCNDGSASLVDLVVSELARAYPARSRHRDAVKEVAEQALRDGRLTLLLDGLDEVGRAQQHRVFGMLRDFARDYPECQVIVTCRDVVYQGQPLGPRFTHVVRVAEFDDAAIIRFLGKWEGLAGTSAAAEVFASLQKNPALMRLARSPLLLTMIAYLQTEVFAKTGRRLPTSRPAFYQEAITHLLRRDTDLGRADSLTVYEVGEKLAVLQRVALVTMESTTEVDDRLTVTKKLLDTTTRELLPDLNLDQAHIKPLLDEIVDRSQLLVSLTKNRTDFVFRHLTLQEYLAATELADDSDGLLRRYLADPLAWRETVKLWCGASNQDSTKVIHRIFGSPETHHKILALECLAEVKRVDSAFARQVVDHFLGRLGKPDLDRPAIVAAVGTVAADGRPRGQEVLRRLITIVNTGGDAKADAMLALSASGRVEAAEALATWNGADEDRRAALRGMGELALPVLIARAADGYLWAVDDLATVGTPAAAAALAQLIWDHSPVALRAAWWLAALLSDPNVEEELKRQPVPKDGLEIDRWFWQPFSESPDGPLTLIADRIGWWLDRSSLADLPEGVAVIDSRLGIPLALRAIDRLWSERAMIRYLLRTRLDLEQYFREAAKRPEPSAADESRIDSLATRAGLRVYERRLVELLRWPVRAVIYGYVIPGRKETPIRAQDWPTVRKPRRSTQALLVTSVVGVGLAVGGPLLAGVVRSILVLTGSWPLGPTWVSWVLQLFIPMVLIGFVFSEHDFVAGALGLAAGAIAVPLLVFGTITLGLWLTWYTVAAFVPAGLVAVVCAMWASRLERINDNPFRRCLEADAVRLEDRTSVIAS
ncbi:NACHT domain-containing protein [Amycolatopsis sp. FBCC-B4732]|uniref:NACHT domain-containing protein n=1 Tax=Amycolatopsis sp. FBCC-B4732 TaxID=3079339 RepID=UPI001FF461EA|nr:NACHT domain-containing protein [Amycolatopsis sp. FBCC-B4732]UOX86371.1 NACHT domain-containing protein [Amycolatopsis sp. FBCC-B4732]